MIIEQEKKLIKLKKKASEEEFVEKLKEFETERLEFQKRSASYRDRVNAAALKAEKDRFNFSLTYLCSAYAQEEFKDMIEENNVKFFFKKPSLGYIPDYTAKNRTA